MRILLRFLKIYFSTSSISIQLKTDIHISLVIFLIKFIFKRRNYLIKISINLCLVPPRLDISIFGYITKKQNKNNRKPQRNNRVLFFCFLCRFLFSFCFLFFPVSLAFFTFSSTTTKNGNKYKNGDNVQCAQSINRNNNKNELKRERWRGRRRQNKNKTLENECN